MNFESLLEHNHDYGCNPCTGVVQTFRSCLGADPLLEDAVNFRSLLVEYETQRDDGYMVRIQSTDSMVMKKLIVRR